LTLQRSTYLPKPPLHIGELPEGCKLCLRGLKSVLFITGMCNVGCFYCPVNPDRRGRDIMYINDVYVHNLRSVLREVECCLSKGVAITGGEPLLVPDRVYEVSKLLKMFFGGNFHIHLYTHVSALTRRSLQILLMCPVDEVRIHVLSLDVLKRKLELLKLLAKQHFTVGLEVPVIPGFENIIEQIVEMLYHSEIISFVNLNEVDVSPGNENTLRKLGFKLNSDGTVQGSYESGRRLAYKLASRFSDLRINLCTSCTKDLIQIGLRFLYKSFTLSTLHQQIEDDGSVTSIKINGRFTHPGNYIRGLKYRFLPRLTWFEIFEII